MEDNFLNDSSLFEPLVDELQELTQKLEQAKQVLRNKDKKISELATQNANLKTAVKRKQCAILQLSKSHMLSLKQIMQLENVKDQSLEKHYRTQSQNKLLSEQNASNAAKLAEYSKELQAREQYLIDKNRVVNQLNLSKAEIISKLMEQIITLNYQLKKAKTNLEQSEANQANTAAASLTSTNQEISRLQTTLTSLQNENNNLIQQIRVKKDQMKRLAEKNIELQAIARKRYVKMKQAIQLYRLDEKKLQILNNKINKLQVNHCKQIIASKSIN